MTRSFLVGAVARIFKPGCKLDTMMVLEGPQGSGKSTAMKVLAGDWHSDTPIDLQSKDRFVGLRGVWILEMAELDALASARDNVERVKAFISSPSDKYRPPYGRADVIAPRQCVFVGTSNRDDYLRDETGNRRFFPVRTGRIDLAGLAAARDQLWAEAVKLYRAGDPWWPVGVESEVARREQSSRVQADPWAEKIERWVAVRQETSVADVLSTCLQIELGRWTQADQNRVARVLRTLGFDRRRMSKQADGTQPWIYRRVPGLELVPGGVGTSEAPIPRTIPSVPSVPTIRGVGSRKSHDPPIDMEGVPRERPGAVGTGDGFDPRQGAAMLLAALGVAK